MVFVCLKERERKTTRWCPSCRLETTGAPFPSLLVVRSVPMSQRTSSALAMTSANKLDKRERLLKFVDWAFGAGLFPFFDMVLKIKLVKRTIE